MNIEHFFDIHICDDDSTCKYYKSTRDTCDSDRIILNAKNGSLYKLDDHSVSSTYKKYHRGLGSNNHQHEFYCMDPANVSLAFNNPLIGGTQHQVMDNNYSIKNKYCPLGSIGNHGLCFKKTYPVDEEEMAMNVKQMKPVSLQASSKTPYPMNVTDDNNKTTTFYCPMSNAKPYVDKKDQQGTMYCAPYESYRTIYPYAPCYDVMDNDCKLDVEVDYVYQERIDQEALYELEMRRYKEKIDYRQQKLLELEHVRSENELEHERIKSGIVKHMTFNISGSTSTSSEFPDYMLVHSEQEEIGPHGMF